MHSLCQTSRCLLCQVRTGHWKCSGDQKRSLSPSAASPQCTGKDIILDNILERIIKKNENNYIIRTHVKQLERTRSL